MFLFNIIVICLSTLHMHAKVIMFITILFFTLQLLIELLQCTFILCFWYFSTCCFLWLLFSVITKLQRFYVGGVLYNICKEKIVMIRNCKNINICVYLQIKSVTDGKLTPLIGICG